MARRRRTLSPLFSFSTFFLSDLACFQERTSFNFSKFAQSCRRRFTDSFFGVSLLASDADLLRALSLPSAVVVSYSFEPSDPKSNGGSLVLVASDLGSSQIWRAYAPITVFLLFLVGRDPFSVYTRRPSSAPPCFSGSHISIPQSQPSSAASTLGFLCRHPLPSHAAARRILGLVLLGLLWGLQIMGRYLVLGLMGLLNQKPMFSSPQPISYNALFVRPSRLCLRSPIAVEFNLLYLDNCSSPRYQNSSCRGQREIAFTILLLEGENCSTTVLAFMALVCTCVARSCLELEGRSSETLLSDIFKGSANWCFVTRAKVADVLIVISVLVTVSIAKSRSLLVFFASQGLVSLTSSKIVKVRRLHDIYGLSIKSVCIYPFIFYACVFRLPFVAAMVVLASAVTNSSFYGEY